MKLFKATIEMPWRYGETEHKKAGDEAELAEALAKAGVDQSRSLNSHEVSYVVTGDQVAILMTAFSHEYDHPKLKSVVQLGEFGGDVQDQWLGLLARIEKATSQLETLADVEAGFHGDTYNEHANAPIPGSVLHSYNELMLCENSCTDVIQDHLSQGWRIVAVCPQASRRPDYILGRYNHTLDVPTSARRG